MLDAGVLIGFDRAEAPADGVIAALERRGHPLHTTEPVVAQVWRSTRQARLARLLKAITIHPFERGRSVGHLLGATGTSDVVDAHLVLVAAELGEPVLTGDPDDLRRLAAALGPAAPVVHAWP